MKFLMIDMADLSAQHLSAFLAPVADALVAPASVEGGVNILALEVLGCICDVS